MKKILALLLCFTSSVAIAAPVYVPNLSENVTGTLISAGKYGLDVALSGTVNAGSVYSAGSAGITTLAVRKDSAGPLSGVADGDVTPLLVDSNGSLKVSAAITQSVNAGASFQEDSTVTTTPETFTVPADMVEALCQAPSSNTKNVRIVQGAVASSTSGIVLEPGRSEVFKAAVDISYAAESGTQALACQFTEQN